MADQLQQQGGQCDHHYLPPAVKRVEQTHGRSLGVPGQGIDNRADQYLDQSAADRVQKHRDQHPGIGRHNTGQNAKQQQARRGKAVGDHHRRTVADPVDKLDGYCVHRQLHHKIEQHQTADHGEGKAIAVLKNNKQQGGEVHDCRLGHVAETTGAQGTFIVGLWHNSVSLFPNTVAL